MLLIRMRPLTGIEGVLTVLRPDGTVLCSDYLPDGNSSILHLVTGCLIDVTGTHTILVRDKSYDEFGAYDLVLQRLNSPANTECAESISPTS
ncbi:MAG: hypothetical protein IH935_08610, partial [Acidobacteria bacterium]|nr:hypothetical protein [Acidobacteriota bacterium]